MTRSKVSPDGRIPERDVASKLVIIMVGLPARGKSYITKKLQRYLSWQQHNTRIFNVGNRRRIVAGMLPGSGQPQDEASEELEENPAERQFNGHTDAPLQQAASILLNGIPSAQNDEPTTLDLNACSQSPDKDDCSVDGAVDDAAQREHQARKDQTAEFFDPKNESASKLREQVAIDTLDELLDYLLHRNGAVGILDATNSTLHRRKLLVAHVKEREPKLGILFVESICTDQNVRQSRLCTMNGIVQVIEG